jgi:hypothetical protein
MAFVEDERASRSLNSTMGKRVLGIECPVRNNTGDVCKECERVKLAWRAGDAENEKWAREHQAKESYFLNILKRDGEFTALKIGKKVAKSLKSKLEKYKKRHGKAFGFANLDEGEWVAISKEGDHPNFEYEFEMLGEKADSVAEKDVKGLPSLMNITEDFNEGVIDLADISSLSSGDSYEFRMVPIPTEEKKATEMIYRYYHWRCTEADIIGGSVESAVKTGEDTPEEFKEYMTVDDKVDDGDFVREVEEVKKYTLDDAPGCFGHFDKEDEDCFEVDCEDIRDDCAEKTAEKRKKPKK